MSARAASPAPRRYESERWTRQHPLGAGDRASTYLHIVVNWLELAALTGVIGAARAAAVFAFWKSDHFREIYRVVLRHRERIAEIVARHGLLP